MVGISRRSRMLCAVLQTVLFASTVQAHGTMSWPRPRGMLKTQLNVVPKILPGAEEAPIDYCPHCLNCGGPGSVRANEGSWKPYRPFEYARQGITMCGDPIGNNDHSSTGKFANPQSLPFAASFEPGSVVNLEWDILTHHNGFLQFFLCDVTSTPEGDIRNDPEWFSENCFELERVPHPACEAGAERDCGPIDPKFPTRWVLPCRTGERDQIEGGASGKMAYRVPAQSMERAVLQSYWLTANTCNDADNFMRNYNYPSVWAGCEGDGGVRGAHPQFKPCTETGQTPEEFFMCADVTVGGGVVQGGMSALPAGDANRENVAEEGNSEDITDERSSNNMVGDVKDEYVAEEGNSDGVADEVNLDDVAEVEDKQYKAEEEAKSGIFAEAQNTEDKVEKCGSENKYGEETATEGHREQMRREGCEDKEESVGISSIGPEEPDLKGEKAMHSTSTGTDRVGNETHGETGSSRTHETHCAEQFEYMDETDQAGLDADSHVCSGHWMQCGGKGYKGSTTCCDERFRCVELGEYYHQCQPPRRR